MADEEINAGKVIIFPLKTTVGLCPPVSLFSPGLAFKCRWTYKKIGQANCAPFVSYPPYGRQQHMQELAQLL